MPILSITYIQHCHEKRDGNEGGQDKNIIINSESSSSVKYSDKVAILFPHLPGNKHQ